MERQKFSMQRFENPEDLKLFLEKALQESNVFFENLGISDKINEFLGSERVVTIVNEAYEQYIKDISNCCSKAPDGLKELAESLKLKYTEGHEEGFKKNFDSNFKRRLAETLKRIGEFIGGSPMNLSQYVIQDMEKSDCKHMMKDTHSIVSEMIDTLRIAYIKELYSITDEEDEFIV